MERGRRARDRVLRGRERRGPEPDHPLIVLGRLRARRGDPNPWDLLDEALELARRTEELQRLAPVAAARAEARWLEEATPARWRGRPTTRWRWRVEGGDDWALGELYAWRRRAGVEDERRAWRDRGPVRERAARRVDGRRARVG